MVSFLLAASHVIGLLYLCYVYFYMDASLGVNRLSAPAVPQDQVVAQSQAAVVMQKHWRRKQALQRAEFMKKHKAQVDEAVTRLQAVLRGHVARRRLLQALQSKDWSSPMSTTGKMQPPSTTSVLQNRPAINDRSVTEELRTTQRKEQTYENPPPLVCGLFIYFLFSFAIGFILHRAPAQLPEDSDSSVASLGWQRTTSQAPSNPRPTRRVPSSTPWAGWDPAAGTKTATTSAGAKTSQAKSPRPSSGPSYSSDEFIEEDISKDKDDDFD